MTAKTEDKRANPTKAELAKVDASKDAETTTTTKTDPLDHDGDGKKGGTKAAKIKEPRPVLGMNEG